jgi:hypothetical protein
LQYVCDLIASEKPFPLLSENFEETVSSLPYLSLVANEEVPTPIIQKKPTAKPSLTTSLPVILVITLQKVQKVINLDIVVHPSSLLLIKMTPMVPIFLVI